MRRAVLVLVLVVAGACGGGNTTDDTKAQPPDGWSGDEASWEACDAMAAYARDGQPLDERENRLADISGLAQLSHTPTVAQQAANLLQYVHDPQWYPVAADVFSQTCLDLGYREAKH